MPLSYKTIYVDPDADVATIADKIIRSVAQKIFLVVDNDARIAFHVLNFQLLRREAESAGKDLVVISSSIRVQALAAKAGLPVQESRGRRITLGEESVEEIEQKVVAVRLGRPRVADIVPRNTEEYAALHMPRTAAPQRQEPKAAAPLRAQQNEPAPVSEQTVEEKEANILRQETRMQDSAWRKFLRTRKNVSQKFSISDGVAQTSSQAKKKFRLFHRLHARTEKSIPLPSAGITRRRIGRFSFVWVSFVVAVLLVGFFVASTLLPIVSIALTPHTQKAILQIPVHLDTGKSSLDLVHHIVPGQIIEEAVQNSQTFSASTKQNIQTFASGQIRVFNQYSSAPQSLVQNTRFVSQDGLLFHTIQGVMIPGAQIQNGQIVPSSLLVDVVASETGDKYNAGPSTFSIPGFRGTPKFTAFYGKSEMAMKGGFSGVANVVSDADIAQAKDALNKSSSNQALDKLRSHVPSGFVLLDDAIEQEPASITLTAQRGDRADSFSGTIQNSVKAVLFREDDIRAVIESYLKNEYKGDPSTDALPKAAIHYSFQTKDFDKGKFDAQLQVDQVFASRLDTQTIATMVRGMSEANVRSYLGSYPGIDRANVTFWPFWVHDVPDNQERISLKIRYPS